MVTHEKILKLTQEIGLKREGLDIVDQESGLRINSAIFISIVRRLSKNHSVEEAIKICIEKLKEDYNQEHGS